MILLMQKGFSPVIIIVIVAVVLLGAVGFFFSQQKSAPPSPHGDTASNAQQVTAVSPKTESGPSIMEGSYFDLLKAGDSLECEWKPTATSLQPAHVWANGGKARSTITTTEQGAGQPVEANAIFRDGKIYSWVKISGMAPIGFMMTQEEVQNANQGLTPQQKQQALQYQKKMSFTCKPWLVDESKFTPPADIQFQQK